QISVLAMGPTIAEVQRIVQHCSGRPNTLFFTGWRRETPMNPNRLSSDSWTSRGPNRKASGGVSQSLQRNGARLLLATGGFGLFLLSYGAATYVQWTEVIVAACLAIQGCGLGSVYLRRTSEGRRGRAQVLRRCP